MNHSARHSSLRRKLLLLPAVFFAGLIILQLLNFHISRQVTQRVTFPGFEAQVLNGHSNVLQSLVQVEAGRLAARLKPLKTRDEQIAAIIAETDDIRFFPDQSGYFFAYDLTGVRVNVPINKSGNGKNLIDLTDSKGVRFIEALANVARIQGAGFVKYHFEKEGKGVQPKLSYAARVPGTEFFIGAGVYIDNVEEEMASLKSGINRKTHEYLALTIGCFVLVLAGTIAISVWVSESTSRMIRRLTSRMLDAAQQVSGAAHEVSSASQSLAEGASEQAASIEETGASLEEMASMTKNNAKNVQQVNELARDTRVAADRGAADMQTMSAAVAAIQTSSDDISKILKTIDEIAFQTNILALNAAVEAARAGESGMGFAVVADEVRALAQRSAQAARETAEKIAGAISNTAEGAKISRQVERSLGEIVEKVRQVDELAAEVATASNEQSQGIGQINSAVAQMNTVTQRNAAHAEESAAAAEELNAQSQTLKEVVSELLAVVTGRSESVADKNGKQLEESRMMRMNGGASSPRRSHEFTLAD